MSQRKKPSLRYSKRINTVDSRILIADKDPLFRGVTERIVHRSGRSLLTAGTLTDVDSMLSHNKISLAILDENLLPNLKEFSRLKKRFPIPMLLTTDNNIDDFFEKIEEENIKIVFSKPIKADEFRTVLEKLESPSCVTWFGIENYLKNSGNCQTYYVRRSDEIAKTIAKLTNRLEELGFHTDMVFFLQTIWSEIITNGVYHSGGFTREKEDGRHIILPDNRKIVVQCAANDTKFGISVSDGEGKLTGEKILKALHGAIRQERDVIRNPDMKLSPNGRGLDMIRRMSAEYYFVIAPGINTEIITIYDKNYEKDDAYSNLKIFELPESACRDYQTSGDRSASGGLQH